MRVEGSKAELLGTTVELGEAQNDGETADTAARFSCVRACEERERAQGRKRG